MKLFLKSFVYAAAGIRHCMMKERNFVVHCCCALLAVIAGLFFSISPVEWMVVTINTALVLAFEMLNTAIEKICNHVHPQRHPLIKIIKDVAAGAVLVVALGAAICGAIIFLPKIF
ncbi:MAG: diacylglycerol kinase family protein [Chitinophagaceae bacterium]|nr:MAG: diacylglycerol kinase family protein [Chitinophagaceae bacterium]